LQLAVRAQPGHCVTPWRYFDDAVQRFEKSHELGRRVAANG